MNIIEKLKSFNVEITAEMEKAFAGEFVSEKEMEKKISKLQTENEALKEKAETAEETLKGFEGKNFDEITRERDEWKKKAEEAERSHNEKMAKLEKQELLREAIRKVRVRQRQEAFASIQFTSNSAKKAIMSQIAEGVTVKDGKLVGFNDLLEEAKKNDASAFVNTEQEELEQKKAKFTDKMENTQGTYVDKADLGKLSMADYISARRK